MPSRSPQGKNLLQLHTNPSAALSPPITETNTPHSVTYTWANLLARRKTVLKSEEDIFLSLCPFLNDCSLVLNYNDAMSGGHNNKWPHRQKWKMKGKPGHQLFRSFWEKQRKVSPRGPCFTAQKWGESKSDITFPTQHFLGVGYGNQIRVRDKLSDPQCVEKLLKVKVSWWVPSGQCVTQEVVSLFLTLRLFSR